MKDQDNQAKDKKHIFWLRKYLDNSNVSQGFVRFFIGGVIFVLIVSIAIALYLSGFEPELATSVYILILVFFIFFYLFHFFAAIYLSNKNQPKKIIGRNGIQKNVILKESVMEWTIDDLFNSAGAWILFIVAIFLPVMLSFIPNVMLILPTEFVFKDTVLGTKFVGLQDSRVSDFKKAALIYYMCAYVITILIAVEASLLMNISDTGGVWIGMLLVSMIMDIISLYFLNNIGSPINWKIDNKEAFAIGGTMSFLLFMIIICFISSFATILFSRSSREMIIEALVRGDIEALVVEGAAERKGEDT